MIEKVKKRIPHVVIMLGIVSLFTDAATEMIYPLIPVYIAALGSGAILLGIIEGVAETTASMLKLISGVISDKIGKRKLLVLIGYSISSLVRPLTGMVTSAWEIIIVRMFDRVGKGIRTAPRDALIASSVDESIRGKSYGFERAMDNTGAVAGPVIGNNNPFSPVYWLWNERFPISFKMDIPSCNNTRDFSGIDNRIICKRICSKKWDWKTFYLFSKKL